MQILLNTFAANSSTEARLGNIFEDGRFKEFRLVGRGIRPEANTLTNQLQLTFQRKGTTIYTAEDVQFKSRTQAFDTPGFIEDQGAETPVNLTLPGSGSTVSADELKYPVEFNINFINPMHGLYKNFRWDSQYVSNDLKAMSTEGTITIANTVNISALQVKYAEGRIHSGMLFLYGIVDDSYNSLSTYRVVGRLHNFYGLTVPAGFVAADGKTIGNVASPATGRKNVDTRDLFLHLWSLNDDVNHPITGGRGASALADFNANKAIKLPLVNGRVMVAPDGGEGVLTAASAGGAASNVLGGKGGSETVTLTNAQCAAHPDTLYQNNPNAGGVFFQSQVPGIGPNPQKAGTGGQAHSNTQPWLVVPVIIEL